MGAGFALDFATTVLGNPWDMDDAADVAATTGVFDTSFSGGWFHATSVYNDPAVYFHQDEGTPIDATRYHLFTIGVRHDDRRLPWGSVARWRARLRPR